MVRGFFWGLAVRLEEDVLRSCGFGQLHCLIRRMLDFLKFIIILENGLKVLFKIYFANLSLKIAILALLIVLILLK